MLTVKKDDVLLLLKSFKYSLEADGFSNSDLNFIDMAGEKIKNNYTIRTEVNVVYQNFFTLNLIEKKSLSKETKELLYQLKKISNSGSIWTKINDLMTTNTWLGR